MGQFCYGESQTLPYHRYDLHENLADKWYRQIMKRLVSATNIFLVLLWLAACSRTSTTGNIPSKTTSPPLLTWDTDPKTRTVLATFCCDGPITDELVHPYIPEAQIWGDGRFLWTEQNADGVRQVMVKQLTADEMVELLHEITVAGFYKWEEHYVGEPVVDAASQCLTLALAEQTKKVCATHGGAPDAFFVLFDWLSQGAGAIGIPYRPEKAYLTGFQLEDTSLSWPEPDLTWPETLARVPLGEAISGIWLDDDEGLQLLWEATNYDPYHMPVVADGDTRFRIILQVPGVSWIKP